MKGFFEGVLSLFRGNVGAPRVGVGFWGILYYMIRNPKG